MQFINSFVELILIKGRDVGRMRELIKGRDLGSQAA